MGATASPKRTKAAAHALPDEIVEEILARLPAKSLRRFQCVSRSWHSLITSPPFRQLHSSRAGAGSRRPRGLFVRPAGYSRSFHACRRFGGPGPVEVEEILSSSDFAPGNVFPISKSCNGLVLLRSLDYSAHYVWNPSTGDILALPDRTPFRTAGYKPHPFVSYGLGHCPTSDQYKVVRMYWHRDATFCEVFTLDQSIYWRPAATEPPPPCRRRRLRVWGGQGAVLCNGSLHFVAEDGVITAFNVTDETFGTLMPPEGLEHSGFDLTELDGCLCAYFSSQLPTPASPYYIWLLRDYHAAAKGGCGCWEELRCFDWGAMADAESEALKSHWVAPLAMHPDGSTKIMFGTGSCKVFVVDPAASNGGGGNPPGPVTLFSLELEDGAGVVHDGQFATMGFFEESLVPVGRTTDEIILSSPSAEAWCQVLSRLPARTVGRLNQVCKEWRAMIKSQCFVVDSHLQYHQANQSPPQIMFTDGKPNSFKPLEDFIIDASQVPPLVDDSSRVVCSKPCHGLNAGASVSCDFVCNPITGYYKALPLDEDHTSEDEDNHHMFIAGRLGLGYDAEISMHVLVRITYKERNLTTRDYKLECEIRCVEETMCWAELEPLQRPIAADTPPAYSNGKIYWIADSKLLGQTSCSGCYHEIVALDVATREFEILKGPPLRSSSSSHDDDASSSECCVSSSIVELQGQICMVCSHPRLDSMEIWAMKGNGTWSMEYYIDLRRFTPEYSSELVTPIAIDPRDGRILLSTGRALGYYDPKTAEIQTIYCLGKHINKDKKFVPILFQESLVSPRDQVYY